MSEESRETTIEREFILSGIGLHTGVTVDMKVGPAGAGAGILLKCPGGEINAVAGSALESARNTSLTNGKIIVHTVEHVLSALCGTGVTNAVITLSAQEPPALDGSSVQIAREIMNSGIKQLDAPAKIIKISEPLIVHEGKAFVIFVPWDGFRAMYILDHPHPMIGQQEAEFIPGKDDYTKQIAPARTFGLIEEVEALQKAGLALGGSVENAIVVHPDKYSSELRFENEFARHKLLDFIGDLSLSGSLIHAFCIGVRSGHSLNVKAVKSLLNFEKI